MADTEKKSTKVTEVKEIDQLADLYEQGKKSPAKTKHDKVYNFLVVFFTSLLTVCIGVIIGYLIYVFAS